MVMLINILVRCQDKPRVGQDGRPLLNKPKVDKCMSRSHHEKYGNHHYFLSWREPWNKFEDWDWFNARLVIISRFFGFQEDFGESPCLWCLGIIRCFAICAGTFVVRDAWILCRLRTLRS